MTVEPVNPQELLRSIPSIARLIDTAEGRALSTRYSRPLTLMVLREISAELRARVLSGSREPIPSFDSLFMKAGTRLRRLVDPIGRRAVNATGIILHTGLGRAPLSPSAIRALQEMSHFSIVEVDLEDGNRSHREERVARLLQEITGAPAATVVNNNAAATLLILNTFAKGKEVVISRGHLIEIGGSFRMPEIMEQSGCHLKEVGTTNRTYASDFEKAISPQTGALIRVHPSNYRIHGFTHEPTLEELVDVGKRHQVPVIDDLGSGELVPVAPYGLDEHGLVSASIAAGADAVCFSGDKLISGPQAGIICGKAPHVKQMRANPFFRMFRVDKLCLAALEATLIDLISSGGNTPDTPVFEMISCELPHLRARAEELAAALRTAGLTDIAVCDGAAYCGGGSSPDRALPDAVVTVGTPGTGPEKIARELRLGFPSVFCRVHEGRLFFNMRTLRGDDLSILRDRIPAAIVRP